MSPQTKLRALSKVHHQNQDHKEVSVQADCCSGDTLYTMVSNADGKELFRHSMPNHNDKANMAVLEVKYPGAMPYFFSQDPDCEEHVAKQTVMGEEAKNIANIHIASAALSVAAYHTPLMKEQLS
ncbi:hypothetical protein ACHAW6_000060 [Cyclotella cf. meneghiniana]